jgi:glycerate dehydrogenase
MTRAVLLDRETLDIGDLDFTELESSVDELVTYDQTSSHDAAARIGDAQVVIVNKVVLSADVIEACPALELICVLATGVNNIDLEAARRCGVTVVNCRAYGTEAVSQHAIAMMLALHTRLVDYHQAVRAGRWEQAPHFCFLDYPIREVAGRTLLVVGHGELGAAVARKAECLGMRVQIAERPGAETVRPGRVAFEKAIAETDVATIHCPLTQATHDLFNARVFERMKPDAFIINTARGGIVNESDLADALRRGAIAGAGMDVLTEEPPKNGNPLLAADIPNLIMTPHSAWGSRTARQRIVSQTCENITAWKAQAPIRVVA